MHPMDSWHGRQGIGPHPSLNSGVLPPKRDPAADVPGNHLDDCGVCVILPTVSGKGVRGTQVSCPVHGEARSDLPEGQQSKELAEIIRIAAAAIPYELIGTPAVGIGDARRLRLAEAIVPAVVAQARTAALRDLAEAMRAAPHAYVSTACLHGLHDRCRLVCKFCSAPCSCGDPECSHDAAGKRLSLVAGSPTPEVGTHEHPGAYQLLYDTYRAMGCPVAVDPCDPDDCANVAAESVRVLLAAGFLPPADPSLPETQEGAKP